MIVEGGILHRCRVRAGSSDGRDPLLRIVERLSRRRMPDSEQLIGVVHVGDPTEFAQVGFELRRHSHRLIGGKSLADDADHGAVARRDLRHVVGGDDAATAGHVDDDQRRVTGDMLAHVTGDEPRILVIVGARRGPHDDADLLAAIEVRDRIGSRRGRTNADAQHRDAQQRSAQMRGAYGRHRQTSHRVRSLGGLLLLLF